MVGTLLTFGKFKLLALIDLDWEKEMELVCPVNKLGTVTVYQSGRHGAFDRRDRRGFAQRDPASSRRGDNGPRKASGKLTTPFARRRPRERKTTPYERNAYSRLAQIPGIEGIWQGHLSLLEKDPSHRHVGRYDRQIIEDTAECKGHWIKASVEPSGRFTVVNGRNGFSKTYTAR